MIDYLKSKVLEIKSDNKKKKAFIILIVFVAVLWLYLVGLLSQMGHCETVSFGPFCFIAVFKYFDRKAIMLISVVMFVAAGFFIYSDFQKTKNMDDRGFAVSKTGTYGTAGWMTDAEMKKTYDVTNVKQTKNFIYGCRGDQVITRPKETRNNPHLAVFGASGSGKTFCLVKPNLMQAIERGESCIVTDPKGELYNDTSEMFRQRGYTVRVLNLVSPENSDCWNCMSDLKGETLMASTLMNVIVGNTSSGKSDAFWDNGEGNLLKALILYVDLNTKSEKNPNGIFSPEEDNLATVYSLLCNCDPAALQAMFDALPEDHPAKAPYNLYAQAGDKVKEGIVIGLGTRIQVLQDQLVKNLVSKNEIDLTLPGREKCVYYVILSAQDSTMQFISSLFFSLFFIKITRYGDTCPKGRLPVPVNIMLDEFCNIGTIGGSADGQDFARVISVVRSYGLQITMIIQSLGQLQNRYQHNLWSEILANCDTQLVLGCNDALTSEFVSEKCGVMTIETESTKVVKKTFAIAQVIPEYGESTGLGKRELLTPDEVQRLPTDDILIFTRSQNVLRAQKYPFFKHPMAKELESTNIYEYKEKKDWGLFDVKGTAEEKAEAYVKKLAEYKKYKEDQMAAERLEELKDTVNSDKSNKSDESDKTGTAAGGRGLEFPSYPLSGPSSQKSSDSSLNNNNNENKRIIDVESAEDFQFDIADELEEALAGMAGNNSDYGDYEDYDDSTMFTDSSSYNQDDESQRNKPDGTNNSGKLKPDSVISEKTNKTSSSNEQKGAEKKPEGGQRPADKRKNLKKENEKVLKNFF